MIRKAVRTDIPAVAAIYERIHAEEQAGRSTTGWLPGVYPVQATAEAALARGDLFVLEEDGTGTVIAAAVINQQQVDVYAGAAWAFPAADSEVMVLHTLTVDPLAQGKGCGKAFLAFYEDYARASGCTAARMDTNARNTRARAFYAGHGYREVGIVPCVFNGIPGVGLVLLEKRL